MTDITLQNRFAAPTPDDEEEEVNYVEKADCDDNDDSAAPLTAVVNNESTLASVSVRCESPEEVVPHGVSDRTEMECTVSGVKTPHVLWECDMTIAGNDEVNFTTSMTLASDIQTLQTPPQTFRERHMQHLLHQRLPSPYKVKLTQVNSITTPMGPHRSLLASPLRPGTIPWCPMRWRVSRPSHLQKFKKFFKHTFWKK